MFPGAKAHCVFFVFVLLTKQKQKKSKTKPRNRTINKLTQIVFVRDFILFFLYTPSNKR